MFDHKKIETSRTGGISLKNLWVWQKSLDKALTLTGSASQKKITVNCKDDITVLYIEDKTAFELKLSQDDKS